VEHFKDSASIMIATEAGAEGINLQFCSLVINYDLPWNPQRIEQRIGRCHRYGQKHDVVVVNFVDHSNPADKRVYELLAQKFQLFEGVFGASDEVLGTIGSGVDFERRIAEIYQTCRNPQEIEASFQQLQLDLSGEISAAMLKTRQLLLENFDEAVQDKLKLRQTESTSARNRFERLLMDLTQAELQGHAEFDHEGFTLRQTPPGLPPADAPPGRYELPRRSGDAHLYRTGHPLAQALIQQARQRTLPTARVQFSYDGYGTMLATLLPLRGQSGWLSLSVLSIDALGVQEDYLLLAGYRCRPAPARRRRTQTAAPARPGARSQPVHGAPSRVGRRRGAAGARTDPGGQHPQPGLLRCRSAKARRLGRRPESGPGKRSQRAGP
jgi:hypothetical protein